MSNVIRMTAQDPRIWVCECGCSTFNLVETGDARCAACMASHDAGGWAPDPEAPAFEGDPWSDVQGNGEVSFARRRVAELALQDDACLIVVARDCGRVSAWGSAETEEQADWVERRLSDALALIRGAVE